MPIFQIQVSRTRQINPYEPLTVILSCNTQDISLEELDHEYELLKEKVDKYVKSFVAEERHKAHIDALKAEIKSLKQIIRELQPNENENKDDYPF